MSEDEIIAIVAGTVVSFFFWVPWFRDIAFIYDRRKTFAGFVSFFVPFLSMVVLFMILRFFSSIDVKSSPLYLTFYMILGCGWCGIMTKVFSFLGLDFRQDVAEQDNYAADVAISGAVFGTLLCFAGGNIGNGPGWWVVIICAAISTGALVLIWIILDQANAVCDAITIDRDMATAIRFAGMMIASGVVLGRAVAGDWVSLEATWRDFFTGAAPLVLLVVVALIIDRLVKPSPSQPRHDPWLVGALPAFLYCGLSVFYVINRGAW